MQGNQRNRSSCNNGVIRAQDAIIERIFTNNRIDHVTISYGVRGDFNMIKMELVTLIVGPDTIIRDQFGRNLRVRDLRVGMVVNAQFSCAMTQSIPPQANAFSIIVQSPRNETNTRIGTVLRVNTNNNFFVTGNPTNLSNQMRFNVNNSTVILDRRGNRIRLRDLRVGQTVRVEHAAFQTASIPPQSTAFRVQIL